MQGSVENEGSVCGEGKHLLECGGLAAAFTVFWMGAFACNKHCYSFHSLESGSKLPHSKNAFRNYG